MTWFSIIPPVVAIIGAALTKRIIPSLVLGLLAGTLLKSGGLIQTFLLAGDYLTKSVATQENAYIILFLFCFGALAEIFKVGGGISGFAKNAERYVKTERDSLLSVWAVTPFTFLDCCFHVISTGTITKPLNEKVKGSTDKLALIINVTSSQLIVLIPFATTYVGYILGVLSNAMTRAGLQANPYQVYLSGVFLNFYSITIVLLSILIIFFKLDSLKILQPAYKKTLEQEGDHDSHAAHEQCEFEEKVPPRIANLLVPLTFLLGVIIYLFWATGHTRGAGFWSSILNADFERAIFVATIATLVFTAILYTLQKIPMKELQSHFLIGGTDMLPPIVVLILAWAITGVTEDLGFTTFVKGFFGTSVPYQFVPVLVFILGALTSYFMGSSWGTWALVMPIALTMAVTTGASIPLTVGAVLAGGSVGDNISPLGETPVLTSAVTEIPVTKHIGYILPYGIAAVVISSVLYLILAYI